MYRPELKIRDSWRNSVLPVSIKAYSNFLIMDDLYVSVLFGHDYESSLNEGKVISTLSQVPFPSYVTLDYAPVSKKALVDKLEAAHMNNEKAISNEIDLKRQNGQFASGISYTKEKKKDELESYRDQVDDNNEGCFFLGLLVVVTADTEELLVQRVKRMQAAGRENGVMLDTYNYRQLKALNTALPFGGRQVDVMRTFLTSSVVALQPYYAQDIQEFGGYVYGVNKTTKRLVIGNRKTLVNPHGMIVGHTGSGKGMMIKQTELSQTLLSTNDDILIIDPQNEYEEICLEYGGEYFDFSQAGSNYINPYEIPEEVFYGTPAMQKEFVSLQSKYSKAFCTAVMNNILVTQEHNSVIDVCVKRMYEEFWQLKKLKRQPLLSDLWKELEVEVSQAENPHDEEIARTIYNSLREYIEGSYDMMSHESNVDIHKRIVGFGLRGVAEDKWEPAMVTIMHYLSNRMEYNQTLQKATRLIVGETQVVCEHESSAETLLRAVVTYRKFGGICTMELQNLARAVENKDMRDMFSNCSYKCFLDQGGVDAKELAQIQELSRDEFNALNEDIPGYGVMVWGKKVILLDSRIDKQNVLYKRFSTNFHEKADSLERVSKMTELEKVVETERNEAMLQEQKEMIRKIAQYSSFTLQDVTTLLKIPEETAEQLLYELCTDQLLQAETVMGEMVYKQA